MRRLVAAAAVLLAVAAAGACPPAGASTVTDSWLGNSLPGTRDHYGFVQKDCYDAYVDPATGRVFCDTEWDEDSLEGGVYQNGQLVGQLADLRDNGLGGDAITADGSYVYPAIVMSSGGGVARYSKSSYAVAPFTGGAGDEGNVLRLHSGGKATGEAVIGGTLYVAEKASNLVEAYSTGSMSYLGSFSVPSPGRIAADPAGKLWIVTGGQPKQYTTAGKATGVKLATGSVSALSVDPAGNLLTSADIAGNEQVVEWRTDGTRLTAFGVRGGIYATTAGSNVQPKMFAGVVAAQKDTAGNLYVVQDSPGDENAGEGTNIDVYTSAGARAWQLYGLEFVDAADIDPQSISGQAFDVFTADERFHVDLSKPAGQQVTWTGYTLDRFTNPGDPRLINSTTSVTPTVVYYGGQRYLAMSSMWGGVEYFFKPRPGSPFYDPAGSVDLGGHGVGSFDSAGNLWVANSASQATGGGVSEYRFTGLDGSGTPQFAQGVTSFPAPFNQMGRAYYDPAADALYVAGFTAARPAWHVDGGPDSDKVMGTTLARYDHWSQGNRTPTWTTVLPYDSSHNVDTGFVGLISMDLTSSGRIYAVALNQYNSAEQSVRVYAYSQADGSQTDEFRSTMAGGYSGWVDVMNGISSTTVGGSDVVLVENDAQAKIDLFKVG